MPAAAARPARRARGAPPRHVMLMLRSLQALGVVILVSAAMYVKLTETDLVAFPDSVVEPDFRRVCVRAAEDQDQDQDRPGTGAALTQLVTGLRMATCVPRAYELAWRGVNPMLYPPAAPRDPLQPWYLGAAVTEQYYADVGRQLFVDDALIDRDASSPALHRVWVPARADPAAASPGPLSTALRHVSKDLEHPAGLVWDARASLYRAWYLCAPSLDASQRCVCALRSADLHAWEPETGAEARVRGAALCVAPDALPLTGNVVAHVDPDAASSGLFKLAAQDTQQRLVLFASHDGVRWTEAGTTPRAGAAGSWSIDRTRGNAPVYVWHLPQQLGQAWQYMRYWVSLAFDVANAAPWLEDACEDCINTSYDAPTPWIASDTHDTLAPTRPWRNLLLMMLPPAVSRALERAGVARLTPASLVAFDVHAYESVYLGLLTLRVAPDDERVWLAFSRDAHDYARSEDRAHAFAATTSVLTGTLRLLGSAAPLRAHPDSLVWLARDPDSLDVYPLSLRRDGFAAMTGKGVLMTRVLRLRSRESSHLFLNAHCAAMSVQVLDAHASAVLGGAAAARVPVTGTRVLVASLDAAAASNAGVRVRITTHDDACQVFALWFSRDPASGCSGGWLGVGGPGSPESYTDECVSM